MGIFTNNITPSIPVDTNWNNLCWDIFSRCLWKTQYGQTWWNYSTKQRIDVMDAEGFTWDKNAFKRKLQNMKRLPKHYQKALEETMNIIYSKYGIWTKGKVQMGKNGRIKTIHFVKFC